jgi:hypothetical protein
MTRHMRAATCAARSEVPAGHPVGSCFAVIGADEAEDVSNLDIPRLRAGSGPRAGIFCPVANDGVWVCGESPCRCGMPPKHYIGRR